MTNKKNRTWADFPEPLPAAAVDSHAHLDLIEEVRSEFSEIQESKGRAAVPAKSVRDYLIDAAAAGVTGVVHSACDLPAVRSVGELLVEAMQGDRSTANVADTSSDGSTDTAADTEPQPMIMDGHIGQPLPGFARVANLVAAVAIHPNEAALHAGIQEPAIDGLDKQFQNWHEVSLEDAISEVYQVAQTNPLVTAIGETGMDFFRTAESGQAAQRLSFREHIRIAQELNLPIQIHDRLAHAEILEVLDSAGILPPVVFHSFSGDQYFAKECIQRGFYLSFSGPITYKKNDDLRAALLVTPLSQLLVETDAPFLTPEPFRGTPNAPYVVSYTLRYIAQLLERPLAEVCQATFENSQTLVASR
ncbi:MAG: TatD family hydrolase [Bifidobacteriaceae bacterium]|jgi:TatD DNase family protein|nr:TatD family hydrolase [Bifidobacteriaceae bacterium]